jgi:Secretion system C-terminal sorting domain
MTQLYMRTLTLCFLTLLIHFCQAQTTFTAILPGAWHTTSPNPSIWQGSEPPRNCNGCTIILAQTGTVTLNVHEVLSDGAKLVIDPGATLQVDNSGGTTVAGSDNVVLNNVTPASTIQLVSNTSTIDAAGIGEYDGIIQQTFTGGTEVYVKEYGVSPESFTNTTLINRGPAQYGTTGVGPVTLSSLGVLPITLTSFTAVLNEGAVDLAWTTEMESNSDHFGIERSSDAGAHWNTIGTVPAHGNSSLPLSYTYVDNNPAPGTNEYRLQLVDINGNYTYSNVATIRNGLVGALSVYPNPATDYVNITLGGNATGNTMIRLFNLSGQLLQEKNLSNAGGTTVPLAVSGYSTGTYLLVISTADGSKQVTKLLITR